MRLWWYNNFKRHWRNLWFWLRYRHEWKEAHPDLPFPRFGRISQETIDWAREKLKNI